MHGWYLCKAWAGEWKKLAPQVRARNSRYCSTLLLCPASIALSRGSLLLCFPASQRGGCFYSLGFCLPAGFSSPLAEGGLGMLQAARCRWLGDAHGGSHGLAKAAGGGCEPLTHALLSPAWCQHRAIGGTAPAGHGPSACGCPSGKVLVTGTQGWLGSSLAMLPRSLPRAEQGRGEQRSGVFPKGQG